MKRTIIAGNWKMHKSVEESLAFVKTLHYTLNCASSIEVIVAPSTTALYPVANYLKNSFIEVAAQNLFWADEGAYTGEISASQIKSCFANYVIVGHSERRQYFGETNESINKKIKAAITHDLTPILCIGETLEQRKTNAVEAVLNRQLTEGLNAFSPEDIQGIIIAYEPIWAIGTGLTATPEQAEEAHQIIRHIIAQQFGGTIAEQLPILYGGSVKPSNAKELLSQPNINGALIGGASLNANDFAEIIKTQTR